MRKLRPKVRLHTHFLMSCCRIRHSRSLCCLVLDLSAAAAEAKTKSGEKEVYKGDSKFASHLKTSAGVSMFSKSRTLKEQREYLPAFACREDLLRTIRDNQGLSVISVCTELFDLSFVLGSRRRRR